MNITIGSFVFLERLSADNKNMDYESGEYIVVRKTPHAIYGVKAVVGYGFHQARAFPIVGERPWTIVSIRQDEETAKQLATDNYNWSTPTPHPRQWIESVYTEVRDNAKSLAGVFGLTLPAVTKPFESSFVEVRLSPTMERLIEKFGCQEQNVRALIKRLFVEIK